MTTAGDGSHPPVQVDNFTEYFARITANEGDDLEEEYQVHCNSLWWEVAVCIPYEREGESMHGNKIMET